MASPEQQIEPGSQNKANWKFGELLIAVKEGDLDAQSESLKHFHRLAPSIAQKEGLFHPVGVEEWISVANATLAEQASKYSHLSTPEIREQRATNSFAYVYTAQRNKEIDEVRRLCRRPLERATDSEKFLGLHGPALNVDLGLQREQNLRMIECAQKTLAGDKPICAVLCALPQLLREPDFETVRDAHAQLVATIAGNVDVSVQQARKYIACFRDTAEQNETLRTIVQGLRYASALAGTQVLLPRRWDLNGLSEKEIWIEAQERG